MKLIAKLTSLLVVGNCVVLAGYGLLAHQRELDRFERSMERDTYLAGATLLSTVKETWRGGGEAAAVRLIERASERQEDMSFEWHDPAASSTLPLEAADRVRLEAGRSVHRRAQGRLYTYLRFEPPNHPAGVLSISKPLAEDTSYLRTSTFWVGTATLASVAVSGLIAFFVGSVLIGRPIEGLVKRVEGVGDGNLTDRLDLTRKDEIGSLARAIDRMAEDLQAAKSKAEQATAERLATLSQLRHAERLATVGRLGAGLAHELGTPLNVVLARAKLLTRQVDDPEKVRSHGEVIGDQVQKMTRILRQLLDFARRGESNKEPVELSRVVSELIDLLAPLAQKQSVALQTTTVAREVWACADRAQMEQVLTNLVMNAIHASPRGEEVRLEVTAQEARPPFDPERREAHWRLSVIDRGPGIPADHRERIFEPFFTTKDVGEGTGLGLTVAHGIVAEHGGWIEVGSGPGGGARFDVFLPQARAPVGAAA